VTVKVRDAVGMPVWLPAWQWPHSRPPPLRWRCRTSTANPSATSPEPFR